MGAKPLIKWDADKDDILKTYWENGYADWEIAEALGSESYLSVRKRRRKLGFINRKGRRSLIVWEPDDDKRIEAYWLKGLPDQHIADLMGIDEPKSITRRRRQLGFVRKRSNYQWTEERELILRGNLNLRNAALAALLGTTFNSVVQKKKELGLRKGDD